MPLDPGPPGIRQTLSDLQVGLLPRDGTDLSSAIKEASLLFKR